MTEPQLAKSYNPERHDPADYLISTKFDGVRAIWDGSRFISRGGHAINAPDWFLEQGAQGLVMDGELYSSILTFDEISGLIRSNEIDEDGWAAMHFYVFDAPEMPGDFTERLEALKRSEFFTDDRCHCVMAAQWEVRNQEELMGNLASAEEGGYEGLMLRRKDAPYSPGKRNPDLLKLKSMKDCEVEVVGHEPGKGKHLGRLGALWCELDGVRFKVGTGFTDAEREEPPAVGSRITVRYQSKTKTGRLRFPAFLRVRNDQ